MSKSKSRSRDRGSDDKRYFDNYADNPIPERTGSLTTTNKVQIRNIMIEKSDAVFLNSEHGCSGGIYVGSAGVAYAYVHIRNGLDGFERKKFEPEAIHLLEKHRKFLADTGMTHEKLPGFLHGKPGVDAVACVFGKMTGNEVLEKSSARSYAQASKMYKESKVFGLDELFIGRAGYLLGALWLQEHVTYCPVAEEDLRDIWRAILKSGRRYALESGSRSPLMYIYHDKEYLGAAHGLCSILQVLMSFPKFLAEDSHAVDDIRRTVDFYMSLQDPDGNYPSSTGKTGIAPLVHWCHGAAGAIHLFAKAYLVFRKEAYLRACISCGDLIWSKGLLKKGPGICHGIAGNGYAFLLLNKLLNEGGEGLNFWRATKFAEFLSTQEFVAGSRVPDRPYSLFEGLAGTVCFLHDLLFPQSGGFPFFNVFYDYKDS